jgi:hypothetical protein
MRRTNAKPLHPKIIKDLENFDNRTSVAATYDFKYRYYETQTKHFEEAKADGNVIFKEKMRKIDWRYMPKSQHGRHAVRSIGKIQPIRPSALEKTMGTLKELVSNAKDDATPTKYKKFKKKVELMNKTIQSIHDTIMESANLPISRSSEVKEQKEAEDSFILQTMKKAASVNSLNSTYSNIKPSSFSTLNKSFNKTRTETSLIYMQASTFKQLAQRQYRENSNRPELSKNRIAIIEARQNTPSESKLETVEPTSHIHSTGKPYAANINSNLQSASVSHLSQIDEELSKHNAVVDDSTYRPNIGQIHNFMVDSPVMSSKRLPDTEHPKNKSCFKVER